MARKRLTPAKPEYLGTTQVPRPASASAPPIAQVAAEAAAAGALGDLADEMTRLRAEGRLILEVPLEEIDEGHLSRDRVGLDSDEMRVLAKSIMTHGQRSPVELSELPAGGAFRYGLISGWRRINAIRQLHETSGMDRFRTVLAVIRQPRDAADAYVSMVEENEVRVGLSYYERAKVAAEATKLGVFESEKKALLTLFDSASRAKRSRIRQFLMIYHTLGDVLEFPNAIGERTGLSLVALFKDDPEAIRRARAHLQATPRHSEADELQALLDYLQQEEARRAACEKSMSATEKAPKEVPDVPRAEHLSQAFDGFEVALKGRRITISGSRVDEAFYEDLLRLLAER